jgi:predicted enzyme related to lactoylglutathione lyase
MSPSKFVWHELMTTDTKAAEAFYTKVVGWQAADSGMPGGVYTIFSTGSTRVAGLMGMPPDAQAQGAPPSWIGYIGVDKIHTYVEKVKAAGGTIIRDPEDIPGVGRFAVAKDPHGAVFALFSTDYPPQPSPAPGTPGVVGWNELYAGDLNSAWAFYSELFGWTKADAMDMGPHGIYQLFSTGEMPDGGMMTKMPQTPVPCWLYYFNVETVDAAVDRINQAGGKIVNGPMEVPGGSWIVQALDPQGAMFAVVAPKR